MILYPIRGLSGEHFISEIRRIQALHPGLRVSGTAMLLVSEPDQLELFENDNDWEGWKP